jgi:hypothetical protein
MITDSIAFFYKILIKGVIQVTLFKANSEDPHPPYWANLLLSAVPYV